FYQERIANEGYLRTADERRSILELGRLVGYKMRPGVSASAFLAYTIDENSKEEVTIPAGSRVQSIPGPDELPQTFESSEDLKARSGWNNLRPRMTQPQTAETIGKGTPNSLIKGPRVYLKGINANLKTNDRLLIDFDINNDESPPDKLPPELYCVTKVEPDAENDRTLILLKPEKKVPTGEVKEGYNISPYFNFAKELISSLDQPASRPPANRTKLLRNAGNTFGMQRFHPRLSTLGSAETNHALLKACNLKLRDTLAAALAQAKVALENKVTVYALRKKAAPFGHNAPLRAQQVKLVGTGTPRKLSNIVEYSEWEIDKPFGYNSSQPDSPHQEKKISLDNEYNITKDDWIVIITPDFTTIITKPINVVHKSIAAYGVSGPISEVYLPEDLVVDTSTQGWIKAKLDQEPFSTIRGTTVYCQPEELALAEKPIDTPIGKQEGEEIDDRIELDGFYEDLESGRRVIVSGEREIAGTSGVRSSELAMLSSVTQDTKQIDDKAGPDEKIHTFIKLAEPLEYTFKRDTVKIHGNVIKATHGETRREVLGSGDGSKGLQAFALKQKPLTHVSA
ncbi:MAG: hypothetical protein D3923_13150, partial [Candidatus Electrothrix sp. AR3]|nr:hypothetical protein [Candidatus Electrothrix sp. AR3]